MNARIQSAANQWLQRQQLDVGALKPEQFRKAIDEVSTELKVPKAQVLEELMAMWTANNERGHGKEQVTGGNEYQGAAGFRSVKGSALGVRMQNMTGDMNPVRGRVDLNTVLDKATQDQLQEPFQKLMRSQGDGMSPMELQQAVGKLGPAHDKLRAADQNNEDIDLPLGVNKVPSGEVGGLSFEGAAKKLADKFEKSGQPQAARVGDTMMVVDKDRPSADAAFQDWQQRDNNPANSAKVMGKALGVGKKALYAAMDARPDRVDVNSLVDVNKLEKPAQRMMRTQGEGMSKAELEQDLKQLEGALEKIDVADRTNALLDCPPGTELMTNTPGVIPESFAGDVVAVDPRGVQGKGAEGIAQALSERFEQTGVPQAFEHQGALLVVDERGPEAAVKDWEQRKSQPRLANNLRHAVWTAKAALSDLG